MMSAYVRPSYVMARFNIAFFCLVFSTLLQGSRTAPASAEDRLLERLFANYSVVSRPVLDSSKAVQCQLYFSLAQLDELNAKTQTLQSTGWLTAEWIDERLTWNETEFDGVDVLVVPPTNIWIPSFAVDNSAGSVYNIDYFRLFRASLYSDGSVIWEPGGVFTTKCTVHVTYYPFDDQECTLVFANWVYVGNKVNLTSYYEKINMEFYTTHGEWDVISTKAERVETVFECCPDVVYPEVIFTLYLRRKALFYVMNVIVPSVFLSTLVLLVFYLPPGAGEKISLGVTLLLAFSVFVLMIADNVPNTSEAVPLISIYLTYYMAISSAVVLMSVIVLNLYHRSPDYPPPYWLKKIIFGYVARTVRHREGDKWKRENNVHPDNHNMHKSGNGKIENGINVENDNNAFKTKMNTDLKIEDMDEKPSSPNNEGCSSCQGLFKHVEYFLRKDKVNERREQIADEWKNLAAVVDAFGFWFFFVLVILGSMVIIFIFPTAQPNIVKH